MIPRDMDDSTDPDVDDEIVDRICNQLTTVMSITNYLRKMML